METVNLQSVAKAVSPKVPSVAIAPADLTVTKAKLGTEVSGNVLPPSQSLSDLSMSNKADSGLKDAVSKLNDFVQNIQRGIQFSLHEETGRSVITITDKETGEEIRQFPSEELLAISAHISETLAVPEEQGIGLLVNGKA
ncbi:MAG: flagellar protein FlaG [Cycloclasticus sp.]|nr:flagellar protein FlaG [Cycloclasticus sp.]